MLGMCGTNVLGRGIGIDQVHESVWVFHQTTQNPECALQLQLQLRLRLQSATQRNLQRSSIVGSPQTKPWNTRGSISAMVCIVPIVIVIVIVIVWLVVCSGQRLDHMRRGSCSARESPAFVFDNRRNRRRSISFSSCCSSSCCSNTEIRSCHTNPYLHCRSRSLPCCWPGSTFGRPEDCHCHCHFARVFANQPDTQQKSNHQQRPLIIFF
jgi:hypothetical protein